MELTNSLRRVVKKYFSTILIFIFAMVSSINTYAQNIFLKDSPGIYTFGKYSYMDNLNGPAAGLNYSFNGTAAIGVSYGSISENRKDYRSMSIHGNLLVNKQAEGDLINFEVIPAFERKYNEVSDQYLSLFSFGAGVSRDLSPETDFNLIPRAFFSYLMSPSVGVSNYLSAGLDLNVGVSLSKNLKFIIDPGVIFRLDTGQGNSAITGGLLIH